MRKLILRMLVGLVVVSIVATFSLTGCKEEAVAPAEEVVEEPVVEEPVVEEPYLDKWVIPAFSFLTGVAVSLGKEIQFGGKYAEKQINDAGGISGVPLEVIWYDTPYTEVDKAVSVVTKAIDQDPIVLLGPPDDLATTACGPIAIDNGILMMNVTSGEKSSAEFYPWAISFISSVEKTTTAAVKKWLEINPGMKKIVVYVTTDSPTAQQYGDAAKAEFDRQGIEHKTIPIPYGQVNFGPLATNGINENPDGFLFALGSDMTAKTIIELQNRGWKDNEKILLYPLAAGPDLWALGKGRVDNIYTWDETNYYSTNPRWVDLSTAYTAEFDVKPSFVLNMYYDALFLIKQCIEDLKITGNPEKLKEERLLVRDYIGNVKNFESVFGPVDIVDGTRQNPVYLFQIINDELNRDPIVLKY